MCVAKGACVEKEGWRACVWWKESMRGERGHVWWRGHVWQKEGGVCGEGGMCHERGHVWQRCMWHEAFLSLEFFSNVKSFEKFSFWPVCYIKCFKYLEKCFNIWLLNIWNTIHSYIETHTQVFEIKGLLFLNGIYLKYHFKLHEINRKLLEINDLIF